MKKLMLILFVFAVLSIGAAAVSAQSVTRIHFARGATHAIVTGTLNGYKSHRTYVIRVRKGQTLTTEAVTKNQRTII